ncbi:hypothetical protein [Ktedonosporobacter rubrisoli]|uniref:hypothetical protein n=1 Tax=Ktedonosporobacter rubrisoli TaxID=2509675 RepID=UPI0013EE97AC|nr:hypothetical protein [Ktedonosporobacter rubrisoli]
MANFLPTTEARLPARIQHHVFARESEDVEIQVSDWGAYLARRWVWQIPITATVTSMVL